MAMLEDETRRVLGKRPFLKDEVVGKRVLLHVCCGPDATQPIRWLLPLAEKLVCYFYDPNIYPPEEYLKRLREMRKLAQEWCVDTIEGKYFNAPTETTRTDFVVSEEELLAEKEYDAEPLKPVEELGTALKNLIDGGSYSEIIEKLRPFAGATEGGDRCSLCFDLRLTRTSALTKILGFDAFATTLTISPKKNVDQVNLTGENAGKRFGVRYVWTNFKKHDGFKDSVRISRDMNLYRQEYCGCKWSAKA